MSRGFEEQLLAAASDPTTAEALARRFVSRAVVAVAARGVAAGAGDPVRSLSLIARIHALLGDHAARWDGRRIPSGTDVGLAELPDPAAALAAGLALCAELEAARDPGSHRHGGLVGVGICFGHVLEAPDGARLGLPLTRALRLALHASHAGELLAEPSVIAGGVPDGVGTHQARRDAAERLGFPFVHLADYR